MAIFAVESPSRTSQSRLSEIQAAWAESDRLFKILRPEAMYERPIDQRHRVIFYLGHLDGFDSIQIVREGLGVRSQDESLDELFQAGIDPDSGNLPMDSARDWPSLDEVRNYVERCRAKVDRYLGEAPEDIVHMAVEHRLMHLETLAYMFHNFAYSLKQTQGGRKVETAARPSNAMLPGVDFVAIPGGAAILGKAQDGTFGWDNEFVQHSVSVPAFGIDRYKVTSGQYLEFVRAGASMPNFWADRGQGIYWRGMFEDISLPMDWPVYVTQAEAEAYARWRGGRLPTEAEFHRAAYGDSADLADGRARTYPWGEVAPGLQHGNFDFRQWDPEPVWASPAGASAFGVEQLVGNGWEWTSTEFRPFPGFEARASYPGYSANFFDGEHFVIKGGSPRTAARLLRPSFRNWFRRDYPYVYGTFRCVRD